MDPSPLASMSNTNLPSSSSRTPARAQLRAEQVVGAAGGSSGGENRHCAPEAAAGARVGPTLAEAETGPALAEPGLGA